VLTSTPVEVFAALCRVVDQLFHYSTIWHGGSLKDVFDCGNPAAGILIIPRESPITLAIGRCHCRSNDCDV
jgi:hypothetical protein